MFSLWFTSPYSDTITKGPSVWRKKLQMFGCSHWLIIKMLSLTALKWKANGKSLEDESSLEISQMYLVLAGTLSLPEHPFTMKTIAHILKWIFWIIFLNFNLWKSSTSFKCPLIKLVMFLISPENVIVRMTAID